MKEYTLIAFLAVAITVAIDYASGIGILRRKKFWVYLILFTGLMMAVNGYITAQKIVRYNSYYFSGIRIGTIPFEDFLFNFSLVTLTVVSWEYFKQRTRKKDRR